MLISVIIAAHNYARFIEEALDSLRAQTYEHWECVVVDDGSKDDTRKVVARYIENEPRVRYFYQENAGAAAARNLALEHARGDFFQFLDADDLIERRKLEIQSKFLRENENVDICYGSARYFPTDNPTERWFDLRQMGEPWIAEFTPQDDTLAVFVTKNIPVNAALIRRSVIERVGNFAASIKFVEDWDFYFRCAAANLKFQFFDCPETLALIRSHAESITQNSARMLEQQDNARKLRKKFAELLQRVRPELIPQNSFILAEITGNLAFLELEQRRVRNAIRLMLRTAAVSQSLKTQVKWCVASSLALFMNAAQVRRFMSRKLT